MPGQETILRVPILPVLGQQPYRTDHQNHDRYQHHQVLRMTSKAKRIIGDLFAAFIGDPRLLPPQYQAPQEQARKVADYIAGMTDRYAMKEHRRLFAVGEI